MAETCAAVDAAGRLAFVVMACRVARAVGTGIAAAVSFLVGVFVITVLCPFCGVAMATPVHLLLYAAVVAALRRIVAVRHRDRAGSGYREKGNKQDHKIST